jgi:predicted RNA-binding Zn-ribbon protein involved in translation (DUF1610 family)
MEYQTIKTFDNAMDAHLFRIELEANDFETRIIDEHIVTTVPFYSNAVGGIKVQIANYQQEKFISYWNERIKEEQLSQTCPNCGSHSITFDFKSIRSIKSMLLFIFSAIVSNHGIGSEKVNLCNQCKTEF